MRVVIMPLVAVLGFVAIGQAEPLDLGQVAADAKWVMHLGSKQQIVRYEDRGRDRLRSRAQASPRSWHQRRDPETTGRGVGVSRYDLAGATKSKMRSSMALRVPSGWID